MYITLLYKLNLLINYNADSIRHCASQYYGITEALMFVMCKFRKIYTDENKDKRF